MSSWATVAIVAIIVWGILKYFQAKNGIITDEYGNERRVETEDPDARRELDELRERIKVLERIATDANTTESRKIEDISREIENLRDK